MLRLRCTSISKDFMYYTASGYPSRADGTDSFNFSKTINPDFYYNYHNYNVSKTASTYKKLLELNNSDFTLFTNDII